MILSAGTQLSPTGEDACAIEELLRRMNRAGAILKVINKAGVHRASAAKRLSRRCTSRWPRTMPCGRVRSQRKSSRGSLRLPDAP